MKKYSNLHPALVERINQEERDAKNPDKASKTRLHQLYGAYIQPNSNKKAQAIINQMIYPTPSIHKSITDLLKLHASTSERLLYYEEFYEFILSHTGAVDKVMDLGCGFNPFSLPFYPQMPSRYHAIDIDLHTKDTLNAFFEKLFLPKLAICEDLETFTPTAKVDLTLMLKLIPVLEASTPGRAYSLANELNTSWLVATFPTKSLGGKKKAMATNYSAGFHGAINNNALSNFELTAETVIGNELVFVLKRERKP